MSVLRRLWSYITPYRWWATLAMFSMLVVAGSNAALVTLSRPLFDEVLTKEKAAPKKDEQASRALEILLNRDRPEGQRGALVNAVDRVTKNARHWWETNETQRWKLIPALLLIVFVVRAVTMFFSEYSFEKVGLSTVRDLRNALYESIITQSSRFFSKKPTGEMVSRIVSDVDAIQAAVSTRMGDLFQESANLIVLATFVLVANTELALISFVVAPLVVAPIVYFGRRLRKATRKSQERMADVATILEETIKGVRIVKAFAMERFEIARFHAATQRHLTINLKARKIQALSSPVMELLAGVGIVLLLGYAGFRIHSGALTVGQFISFVMALAMMYAPIKRLNKVNLAMNTALSAADRVFSILDIENEVKECEGAVEIDAIGDGVRYENVSFAYGDEPVLRDVSLNIRPGEMVAVVGGSGAGKSTLVNLLPRFYDVNGGRITVGGHDIREVTLRSLRGLMGFVTQEVILFNDSIRNNIAYGRGEDISLERIEAAARAANAADFIDALPDRYDAQIGEGGALLSGGQRQRIAIARAILKNPPILILDEATSALDTESERLVQQALANLMEGRTTLVIAHRLSTIRRADKIVVLEAGVVRETGTHDELLERRGIYRKLYDLQFLEDDPVAQADR
ncbi:MAG: ABC transporter ATP-binding protein [Thermoanaerobaculia bacterium]